jgi:hypothetical protein
MKNPLAALALLVMCGLLPARASADNSPSPTTPSPAAKPAQARKEAVPDVALKDALRRDAVAIDLRAAAAAAEAQKGPQASVAPVGSTGPALAAIGSTTAQAKGQAGAAHDEPGPSATTAAAPTTKPAAGPRALRRMDAPRVIASLQDGFRTCYAQSDSRAGGTIVVRANTSGTGEVETVELLSHDGLPLSLGQCVADRVHEARFGAPGGTGLAVMVPVRFGS